MYTQEQIDHAIKEALESLQYGDAILMIMYANNGTGNTRKELFATLNVYLVESGKLPLELEHFYAAFTNLERRGLISTKQK